MRASSVSRPYISYVRRGTMPSCRMRSRTVQWFIRLRDLLLMPDQVLGAGDYVGTPVAVKLSRVGTTETRSVKYLSQLNNELRILGHLRHPNIVFVRRVRGYAAQPARVNTRNGKRCDAQEFHQRQSGSGKQRCAFVHPSSVILCTAVLAHTAASNRSRRFASYECICRNAPRRTSQFQGRAVGLWFVTPSHVAWKTLGRNCTVAGSCGL